MASSWGGIMAAQMGWAAAADDGWRKGPWTAEEDKLLIDYVKQHGEGRWNSVSRITGLKRNGKSCRLRWVNYLRPDLKRGQITPQEENIILDLHARWGNRWSTIARSLPGRTDNEIKNYWRTHFKKKPKSSANNVEKLRARLLRKQQFHQQQQQQQQQQEYEFNELDMKKILSLLEDNDDRVIPSNPLPQMAAATTIASDEQSGFYPIAAASNGSGSEGSVDHRLPHYHHEMPWEGLWSMEDVQVQGGFNALCGANKQANFLQHFVSPFY